MSKKLSAGVDNLSDEDIDLIKDMLEQLNLCHVDLEILTKTLIGTIVSKLKKHSTLGPSAKALVKKWKSVAKESQIQRQQQKKPPISSSPAVATKHERRISTNTATLELKEEWMSLQLYRQTTCQKLHDVLQKFKEALVDEGVNPGAIDHLTVERATDVELAIQNKYLSNKNEYLAKARSLCFNIKKNESLAKQIILGHLSSSVLVELSSENLVNDDKRKEIEERKKRVMDSNLLDWEAQNEDKINEMCGIKGDLLKASLFTCHRCKSTKTTSTQKQTRSADEPMTVFVLCLNCNYRWKFS